MDTKVLIIIISVFILALVLFILLMVAVAKKNADKPTGCVWSERKRIMGLPISFTVYFLTPRKFITRTGLFNLKEDEFELYKVIDKSLELPFAQRMMNCGTVNITIKDTDTPIKRVEFIKNARDFSNQLEKLVDEQKQAYKVKGNDMIGVDY